MGVSENANHRRLGIGLPIRRTLSPSIAEVKRSFWARTIADAVPEDVVTKAENPSFETPFKLQQNVPNPFNPVTKISFEVPDGGANVSLRIYNVSGQLVSTLVDGYESSGTREVNWFGKNDQGRPVASGIYYYRLTAPGFSEKKKMVLLK